MCHSYRIVWLCFWTKIWKMVLIFKVCKTLFIPLSWQDLFFKKKQNKTIRTTQNMRLRGPHVGDSTCLSSVNLILNFWIFGAVITVICALSPSHFPPLLNLCSFCEFNHSCQEAMLGLAERLFSSLTLNHCLLEQDCSLLFFEVAEHHDYDFHRKKILA